MRIAVVGLGPIGSQALLHLAQQDGVHAVGYDMYHPGHGFGASGGENRLFPSVGTSYENYTALIDYSLDVWRRLERRAGRVIAKQVGYLSVSDEASAERNSVIVGVKNAGAPARILTKAKLEEEFGFQRYFDGDVGAFDPAGGMIRTDAAVFEAVAAAVDLGAEVHTQSRVTQIERGSAGVALRIGDELRAFDQVVLTTGPWVHQLAPYLVDEVGVYRPTSAWFLPKEPSTLKSVPALAREGAHQFYAAPTFDGASLKVGYGGLRQQRVENGPQLADRLIDPEELGEFPEILGECLTGFEPVPFRMAQFFEGYTASSRPVIQRVDDRIVAGVGFSGLGFKLSPVFGRLVAETALEGQLGDLLKPVRDAIPIRAVEGDSAVSA